MIFEFSDYLLNPQTYELRRNNELIAVEPQVFDVLAYLIQNRDRVVSRDELFEAVWDGRMVSDATLSSRISAARVVVGDSGESQAVIRTIRGRGFQFIANVTVSLGVEDASTKKAVSTKDASSTAAPALTVPDKAVRRRLPAWLTGALAIIAVAVVGFALWYSWAGKDDADTAPNANRLAVLPFDNISPDAETDYFADGLTEELISVLSRTKDLRVIARTSVLKYRGGTIDVAEIGRELKVASVLEGTVRKAGQKLRITVQLVDVATQEHIWSQEYDRDLEDVFDVQRDIAGRVVAALLAEKRIAAASHQQSSVGTENLSAYDAYLRGRHLWHLRTNEAVLRSVEHFETSIAADPTFARGHSGLSSAYLILGWYGWMSANDAYPKAETAALKALMIDPLLSEAHAILAVIAVNNNYDWAEAERGYRKAIEINPNEAHVHHWYAFYFALRGEPDAALREIDLALDIDPLSVIINLNRGRMLYMGRRYDEALQQLQSTLELAPQFWFTHFTLGLVHLERSDLRNAFSHMQLAVELSSSYCAAASVLAIIKAQSGETIEARSILEELKSRSNREYIRPSCIAEAYLAFPGEEDNFFKWMELEFEQKGERSRFLKVHPLYDRLRSDPRFQALLARSGLD